MSDFRHEPDPDSGEAQWRRVAVRALGGAPLESLNALLDTGAEIGPLQTPMSAGEKALASGYPGATPFVRAASAAARAWQVLQILDSAQPAEANTQAREDLAGGADGLWLELQDGAPYGAGGLQLDSLEGLETALSGIGLDQTPIYLAPGAQSLPTAAVLLAAARKQGVAFDRLSGSLGLDPLAVIAARGEAPVRGEKALTEVVDAALYARREGLGMRPLMASGRVWHQAGGSAVEELACVLASAVAYWRALAGADVPLESGTQMIGFHLSADSDVFVSIAKFRAARALWARVTEAAGIPAQPAFITGEMSFRTMTSRDPHTNLLRATAAAFAAGAGGLQALLLLPFSATAGVPDAFARRMARNTQLILAEESGLGRVTDAPGGSWYVETLTHDLAARSWAAFQDIEMAGGLLAALKSGDVARRLGAVRERRAGEIARRERAITGVSTYPHLDEAPASVVTASERAAAEPGTPPDLPTAGQGERMAALVAAAEQGARIADLAAALREPCEPIPPLSDPARRDAAGFEALRAASDEARDVTGVRPSVFLANIGALAAFTERASWARNLFEAGGIEAIDSPGFNSSEALADAFRESGALIACLCGRDEDYAKLAGVVPALRARGAAAVYVVGKPDMPPDTLPEADSRAIQRVLFEGCDALAILNEAHDVLKVDEVISAARRRAADEIQYG